MAKKALKKLMRDSYRGCINDLEHITDIMKRFSELTLGEVIDMADEGIEKSLEMLADNILNDEHNLFLEDDSMRKLGFLELLYLIDITKNPIEYRYEDYEDKDTECGKDFRKKEPFRYVGMNMILHLFLRTQEISALFRLFLAIDIRTLFTHLSCKDVIWRQSGETEQKPFREVEDEFYKNLDLLYIETKDGMSIEDILQKAYKIRYECWNPWQSLEDYEKRLLSAWEIFDCLLIESFRYAYPERFSMEHVQEKYKKWFTEREERWNRGVDLGPLIEERSAEEGEE